MYVYARTHVSADDDRDAQRHQLDLLTWYNFHSNTLRLCGLAAKRRLPTCDPPPPQPSFAHLLSTLETL